MKPVSVSLWFIDKQDIQDYHRMSSLLEQIPDITFERSKESEPWVLSCHHIAHAFWNFFKRWKVIDGSFYNPYMPHSWLETCENIDHFWEYRNNHRDIKILDLYPIAWLKPQLIHWHFLTPYRKIYIPWEQAITKEKYFLDEVEIVKNEIKKIIELWKE